MQDQNDHKEMDTPSPPPHLIAVVLLALGYALVDATFIALNKRMNFPEMLLPFVDVPLIMIGLVLPLAMPFVYGLAKRNAVHSAIDTAIVSVCNAGFIVFCSSTVYTPRASCTRSVSEAILEKAIMLSCTAILSIIMGAIGGYVGQCAAYRQTGKNTFRLSDV